MPDPVAMAASAVTAFGSRSHTGHGQELINELRRTLGRLEAALAAISDALVITDRDGGVLWCNQAFERLVQRGRIGLLGESILSLLPRDVNGQPLLASLPSETQAHGQATRQALLAKDPLKAVQIEWRVVQSEAERPLVFCLRDISADLTYEAMQREVIRIAEERHHLAEQVMVCAVTGLPNRRALEERLAQAFNQLAQRPGQLTLYFCDLNGFKQINDTHGHAAGDALLVTVGQRLQGCLRQNDLVARLGGDEFVVLSEGPRSSREAWVLAGRLHEALIQPWQLEERTLHPAMSVGIAMTDDPGLGAEELLRQADLAMYVAKGRSDNPIAMHDADLEHQARSRLQLARSLRSAIERQQLRDLGFRVTYRPMIRLDDGTVDGYEAELSVEPGSDLAQEWEVFPTLVDQTGLMPQLGRWVSHQALEQLAQARQQGQTGTLALNIRASELQDETFCDTLRQQAAAVGIDPAGLVLELDEGLLREASDALLGDLLTLREMGVRLVLDHFGANAIHLVDLARLPIDAVKIHGTLSTPGEDQRLLRLRQACVRLAIDLGLEVIADGIATEQQSQELQALGCRWGQGPLFSGNPDGWVACR